MPGRTDALLTSIDVANGKGLELGPLINPVVRKDMGDVRYIDHVDTDPVSRDGGDAIGLHRVFRSIGGLA